MYCTLCSLITEPDSEPAAEADGRGERVAAGTPRRRRQVRVGTEGAGQGSGAQGHRPRGQGQSVHKGHQLGFGFKVSHCTNANKWGLGPGQVVQEAQQVGLDSRLISVHSECQVWYHEHWKGHRLRGQGQLVRKGRGVILGEGNHKVEKSGAETLTLRQEHGFGVKHMCAGS